ncbi:efflux RND transporter periplasmic adaptor subunit [Rhodoferax sp. TBRC 17660]|uniref:Efflux RND transporter periplasmic adaptor subunit n=1 Tax=Rhodoferax potami TaxID=3068338 RepID=A0ABU3KIR9_9BURK|nr:efflux RND transporter periplasmic adaptor subunit [Rhodoferax sp. TBRC 17660]MDT7517669.1 efflux RND transporter periplasmic adaptor subunit [Rhodoferax sp. TBRC 17660]
MKIKQVFQREGLAVLLVATLAACGKSEPQDMAPAPVQVSVMTMAPSHLDITEDLPGRVVALRVAEIRPQVSGIVQRRLFEQGTEVRAGQALFQINPAPFRAETDTAAAALQRAEVAFARAQVQTNRLQPLLDADAISRQTYDDAASLRDQSAADVAQARATLARRQLDLKFSTVEAPISGRIDQALITEGTLVNSGDSNPMARVQQIDQVYVDVRRPASSLESMHEMLSTQNAGKGSGLQVAVLRGDGTLYGAKGRILFSGVNVDAGTGDVLLRVLVDNPERELLPGMFVRARVVRQSYDTALTVPQQAVVRVGGQPQVWTIDTSGTARLSAIELGELVGRSYRVRSGLSAGQSVVVEGMERLSTGASVSAREWQAPVAASVSALR